MCIDPLQRQTETAPTLSHSVSVCFPTWTVTLLRLFRWKSSFFWMSFSLFFITYKVVAMLYLWSSWHFVTVPLTKTFYRRETCWSWWNDLPKVVWEVCSRTDFLPNPYSLPNHKVSVSATLSPLFHFPLPFQSASVRLTHVLFSPFFSLSADACGLGALLQASALRFLMVLHLLHPLLSWLSWL